MRSCMFRSRPLVAALVLGTLLAPDARAARKANHIDSQWISSDFDKSAVRTVAILPAITFDGNHTAAGAVPAAWSAVFPDSGYLWIPADEVGRKLDAAGRLSDLDPLASGEIRRTGAVSAGTAQRLCRTLGVQAVLCLRVDKWEQMLAADSRRTASVEIRCSLVDSSGTELWRVSGRSMQQGERVSGPSIEGVGGTSRAPGQQAMGAPRGGSSSSSGGGQSSGGSSSGGSSGSSGGSSGGSSTGGGEASAGSSQMATVETPGHGRGSSDVTVREASPSARSDEFQRALRSLFADWVPLLPAPSRAAKR